MDPQGFNLNSGLRASDADRDTAASVINNAMAEGRLTADEHSDRLDAIYSAKTHADLVPLLEDLPRTSSAAGQAANPAAGQPARASRGRKIVAILGGASRKGAWHPDPVINVLTVLGGAELDFRDAVLPGNEVVLRAVSVLGGIQITVPPEMQVIDNGVAILGGREITGPGAEPSESTSPVLRIEGICVLGGVEVRRRSRKRASDSRNSGITLGLPLARGLEDVLSQVRDQRHELRDQRHQRRREIHREMHQRRREMRRPWTDDSDS